jgi:prepilin-type N-terminal cleavage/methylation domain-containing protein
MVRLKRWDKTGFTPTPPRARSFYPVGDRKGFTLMELILATAISALVVGILSVCFSFALRVWESVQNQKPDQTFQLADLLSRQLAECDPTPIKFKDSPHPVFAGQPNSIAFVTTHSVKAISQGVPVVVRYMYDPDSKVLNYSELLLDPYHPDSIEMFLAGRSSSKKATEIRSYGVEFPEFLLSFAGKEAKEFLQAWESVDQLPVEVLLRWRAKDSIVYARVCMINAPLSVEVQTAPGAGGGVPGAGSGVPGAGSGVPGSSSGGLGGNVPNTGLNQ